ncbi:kinase-like domain-containing protein [Amylocarpus encephaloides]|uniref:Kinase-like domain-containing protein n=1 Tax=Amylocarpus encephaloides TaxID=45428 RepID=A0A9P7YML2_9HELO|nr:kinase-like domain-containing protein [Amylocarpus encephaloides]
MGDRVPRALGNYDLEYTALAVSQHIQGARVDGHRDRSQSTLETEPSHELPSFLGILSLYFRYAHLEHGSPGPASFINGVIGLQDVEFGVKYPLLGAGQDFNVSESPFPPSYQGYKPIDGRPINTQKYCLKTPNFNSAENLNPTGNFRRQYYDRTLRELQVLLHPHLRTSENIINLFGVDFQEDYDDHTVAWPILFLEYADFGTLAAFQEDMYLGPELSRVLLLDVGRGIQSLHTSNIIHNDIKSENVLICQHHQRKYIARLSGFGLAVINPDPAKDAHKLPGGTFLWSAPEASQALTVPGLQQTDTYSFGLMAWRVFRCDPNPYRLIPPEQLGIQGPGLLRDIVNQAKAHPSFSELVRNTMVAQQDTPPYFNSIVGCTLASQPTSRSLREALSILEQGPGSSFSSHPENKSYWELDQPTSVLAEVSSIGLAVLQCLPFRESVVNILFRAITWNLCRSSTFFTNHHELTKSINLIFC